MNTNLDSMLAALEAPSNAPPLVLSIYSTFNRLWKQRNDKPWGKGLSKYDVQLIRCFLSVGIPPMKLSDLFKVGYYTIRDIKAGKTWKTLPYDQPILDLVSIAPTATQPTQQPKPCYLLVINKFGNDLMSPEGTTCLLTPCSIDQANEYLKSNIGEYTLETIQSP